MLPWLLFPKPDPARVGAEPRILENLQVGLVPIDGDFGRARPAKDRAAEAEARRAGLAAGRKDGSRHPKRAVRPTLPTHARNAVEEWIPSAVLYGPPT